ncbi:hypothetical protein CTAYLR_009217 [Chrysophaeum taylorii]|uniref:Uncharacterized protein n=1 Tax=Chrysophaeum taylorii TaxID=2483200 RepID=A0AAD7XLL3_9STRA|nr:hypothetical protein CTAYLR_009217 [Chrysophaeum taylorii]
MLIGTRDPKSTLHKLAGQEAALRLIATRIAELHRGDWVDADGVFACVVANVAFPEPTGIYCNMLPIVIGDIDSIPENMRHYACILAACPVSRSEWDEIGYLTIDERDVEEGTTQRRPGLHAEATPNLLPANFEPADDTWPTLAWGAGYYVEDCERLGHFEGGLFFASNVARSTRVWNCRANGKAPRGPLGGIDHLRPALGPGVDLDEGDLVWITDQTPHEARPVDVPGGKRQFFRLVTSKIDAWYADHSTPNPLGIVPPDYVTIVRGDKFLAAAP